MELSRWAVSLFALLAVASGASDAFPQDHLGAQRCKACHQAEYEQWSKTAHAEALARLTKNQQRDPVCRACHTMVPTSSGTKLSGVQCESCHGVGRFYEPAHVMRDKKLAALMGLKPVTQATCSRCHLADAPSLEPFDFAQKLEMVRHRKKPPADAQSARPAPQTEDGRDG